MNKGFWDTLPKPFFALAPMADVTDAAFRRVIAKYGKPDITWTEFVSADGLFRGEHPSDPEKGAGYDVLVRDLEYSEEERPIVAQFFSKDPNLMARAAKLAEDMGYDGVDINMGCPDKNVCKQGSGAAMIRTPELAQEIIRATQDATSLPVSVKTRIGYTQNEIETWLPMLLETNPVCVTLHARTKKEMSKVPADWSIIKRSVDIRDELKSDVLIVGNGDVMTLEEGRTRVEETGCDGVMIGRGIFGNPWLFSEQERPPLKERIRVLIEHIELFDELLGDAKSFFLMKKHFKSYLVGADATPETKELRMQLMDTKSTDEAIELLKNFTKLI